MIEGLPRREREVFETLCRLGEAPVGEVRDALSVPLSDSAVRTLLARLEGKGLVERRMEQGVRYRPAPEPDALADGALRRLVDTFFAGSATAAATALLGLSRRLEPDEVEALKRAIDDAGERDA